MTGPTDDGADKVFAGWHRFHKMSKKELVARLDKAVAAGLVVGEPGGRFALRSHPAESQRVSASAEIEP